ncbi:hypothetical protein [Bradyrhizobium sp. BR 10261]|uniref:hypothetical protein n=1 Tax=Bradyrhizobium sp. BR 10261 TaxID=2749992 RepID=UPI001C64BC76|nr:hypothetical protein [Bradyrhizobium sp. BR 10261]MBW7966783.1 hypothetical protein [Bradyrhizobium sp. BR 10261]
MIRDQVLIAAGFMLGYTIAWWQRGRVAERAIADVSGPETTLVVGDLETRFRRSQR